MTHFAIQQESKGLLPAGQVQSKRGRVCCFSSAPIPETQQVGIVIPAKAGIQSVDQEQAGFRLSPE